MGKPLSQIIAAISNEITSAALQADVHRARLQQIYDDNEILKEFSPSRVRLSEMKVSIPLALESVAEDKQVAPELTRRQLTQLLPDSLPEQEKFDYAGRLLELLRKARLHLLSEELPEQLEKMILSQVKGAKPEDLDLAPLQRFKQEYLSHPDKAHKASFIYKASELEKLDPQHIIRIDLSIDID